jgi:hypothetical protein
MFILKIDQEERQRLSSVRDKVLKEWALNKLDHSIVLTGQEISTLVQILRALIELPIDGEKENTKGTT